MKTASIFCLIVFGQVSPVLGEDRASDSLQRGQEALRKFDAKGAIAHLTQAIHKDAKNAEAYYYRGLAYSSDNQDDKARADFDTAIRLNPKIADAFYQRGTLQWIAHQDEKALADLNEAIRLDPKHMAAHNWRARIFYNTKEYARAIADYQQAIRLNPGHPIAHFELARVLATCPEAKFRDGKKAATLARKACERTRWMEHQSLEALAAANAELGNFDEAVKWQKKAIEVLLLSIGPLGGESSKARLKLYQGKKPLRIHSLMEWL